MKQIKNILAAAALLALPMAFTSCEDVLGHWEKPTPNPIAPEVTPETPIDLMATPLTLEATSAGTIKVTAPKDGMQYSLNGGAKTAITANPTEITVAIGDKVAFYGNGTSINSYNGTKIAGGSAEVKVYGNIMSLLDETGFATLSDPITLPSTNTFKSLFYWYDKLTDASGLKLPATTLADNCYEDMFNGCSALTAAPELKATTLKNECYKYMFYGCKALTTAPELKATTLAESCYYAMFYGCKALTAAPELKAETLAEGCYHTMFSDCIALTTAPEVLPATTLKNNCYTNMFKGCTSLTATPKLPATTLVANCYMSMFDGCKSLTTAYVKAAYTNTSENECIYMFAGCTKAGGKFYSVDAATATAWVTTFNTLDATYLKDWTTATYPTE